MFDMMGGGPPMGGPGDEGEEPEEELEEAPETTVSGCANPECDFNEGGQCSSADISVGDGGDCETNTAKKEAPVLGGPELTPTARPTMPPPPAPGRAGGF